MTDTFEYDCTPPPSPTPDEQDDTMSYMSDSESECVFHFPDITPPPSPTPEEREQARLWYKENCTWDDLPPPPSPTPEEKEKKRKREEQEEEIRKHGHPHQRSLEALVEHVKEHKSTYSRLISIPPHRWDHVHRRHILLEPTPKEICIVQTDNDKFPSRLSDQAIEPEILESICLYLLNDSYPCREKGYRFSSTLPLHFVTGHSQKEITKNEKKQIKWTPTKAYKIIVDEMDDPYQVYEGKVVYELITLFPLWEWEENVK